MKLREILVPQSGERIVLVVVGIALLSAGLAQFLDQSLVRWEILVVGVAVLGWAVWAINYRIEESRKEWYRKER